MITTSVYIRCDTPTKNCESRSSPIQARVLGDGRLSFDPPMGWAVNGKGRAWCPVHAKRAPKTGRVNQVGALT